ncbi:unnamed protein product, partial [Pylaiella littoralis]
SSLYTTYTWERRSTSLNARELDDSGFDLLAKTWQVPRQLYFRALLQQQTEFYLSQTISVGTENGREEESAAHTAVYIIVGAGSRTLIRIKNTRKKCSRVGRLRVRFGGQDLAGTT